MLDIGCDGGQPVLPPPLDEPLLLEVKDRTEAWRWSREGLLGGEAWSVIGAWEDGPVVDETVRRVLLTASDRGTAAST